MNKGIFITLEGGEGSGKTTAIERLVQLLRDQGQHVVVTREPGGIPIAEKIRNIILDPEHTMMDARTEAILYAASRRQHLVEKVIPALQQGSIVICDRFIDSSLAYQGHARELGMEEVWVLNQFAIQELMPHLTIYMDIDPEEGLARIARASEREVNRLDLENIDFHEKVREGYKILLQQYPERIVEIDASQKPDEVFEHILSVIKERYAGIFITDVKIEINDMN